ncbi:uncharacterized protein [Miscanthus floridulus]|uniref:uncharacterized protein n=1 Tax=Miscanthus floridulus TaxID=154761 RepID=UPI003459C82A
MGIPWSSMRSSKAPFYRIVPGKETVPLGRIRLSVTFGQLDNFRKEPLTFQVVNFPGICHALLGRPCCAKFMAIPNYTYLKLKMPGPKADITVEGSFEQAYYCEQDYVTHAAALITPRPRCRRGTGGGSNQGSGGARITKHRRRAQGIWWQRCSAGPSI